jgi:phosphatidate cytidylyltransferase
MLRQRILTALVLLAIVLPALFYPDPRAFNGVVLLAIAAAAWEWGRLSGWSQLLALALGAACAALCVLAWGLLGAAGAPLWLWAFGAGAWVLGGGLLLRAGVAGWPRIPQALRLLGGLLALWLAWLAVAQARGQGVNFLLSILALVWVADIGAYFAGRALGLRFTRGKLAPTISPGKSWEGVWGGMLATVVLAIVWVVLDAAQPTWSPSFYSHVQRSVGWPGLVVVVLCLAAMSVVGDLVESLIKRSVGVKDSSHLLPGHGGVLDRIDALLPTLPLAMMVFSWIHTP